MKGIGTNQTRSASRAWQGANASRSVVREHLLSRNVGSSAHFQPWLDRFRPPCPGRRFSGVLRFALENVCRIAQTGLVRCHSLILG